MLLVLPMYGLYLCQRYFMSGIIHQKHFPSGKFPLQRAEQVERVRGRMKFFRALASGYAGHGLKHVDADAWKPDGE